VWRQRGTHALPILFVRPATEAWLLTNKLRYMSNVTASGPSAPPLPAAVRLKVHGRNCFSRSGPVYKIPYETCISWDTAAQTIN
jgi:hypothetical protein